MYQEYMEDATCRNRMRLRVVTRLSVEMQEELIDEGIQTWEGQWEHLLKLDEKKGAGEVFSRRIEILGHHLGPLKNGCVFTPKWD